MNSYFSFYKKLACDGDFFIGENTHRGFVPHVADYVSEDEYDKVYVIKGGPGTGKGTIMRKVAEAAREAGCGVTLLLCSSDPMSPDGVLIEAENKKTALLDGTAPHERDPQYPGACGEIVDLFPAMDRGALGKKKELISELCERKKEYYSAAYSYLSAARRISELRGEIISLAYLREKAEKYIVRLADTLVGKGKGRGRVLWRQTLALSCRGAVRLPGFDGAAKKIRVNDHACLLPQFMESLTCELIRRGAEAEVSRSPLYGIGEIYIRETDTLISPFCGEECGKAINLRRFADTEKLSESRAKLTFSGRCLDMTLTEALKYLADAGELHGELEAVYTPTMDFSIIDRITDRLISEVSCRE